MKETTRYAYEKRIKKLEAENTHLRRIKSVALQIWDGAVANGTNGQTMSPAKVLGLFKEIIQWAT